MKKAKQLKTQMQLSMCILCMAGILFTTILIGVTVFVKWSDQISTTMQSQTDYYASQMDNYIKSNADLLNDCVTMIELSDGKNNSIYNICKSLYGDHTELCDLYVGTTDKELISGADLTVDDDYDPTSRDWYIESVKNNDITYSEAYLDASTNQMCITISKPIYMNGELIGVCAVDIYLDALSEIVNNILSSSNMNATVIDGNNNIIITQFGDLMPTEESLSDYSKILPDIVSDIKSPQNKPLRFKDYDNQLKRFKYSELSNCGWYLILSDKMSNVMLNITEMFYSVIIVIIVGFVASILVSKWLSKQIFSSIGNLKEFVKDKIIGTSNFKKCNSETEENKYIVEELQNKFIYTIKKTKTESTRLSRQITTVTDGMTSITDNIVNISDSMKETGNALNTQTSNIAEIVKNCNEIGDLAAAFVRETSGISDKSELIISDVIQTVDEVILNKDKAVSTAKISNDKLSSAIEGIKVIEEINNISDTIQGIAGRTNLLALNASIEAARAGEAGKGFAVVAGEINSLAQETKEQTGKISNLVLQVNESVESLTNECRHLLDFVEKAVLPDYENYGKLADDYLENCKYYSETSKKMTENIRQLNISINSITDTLQLIDSSQANLGTTVQQINTSIQDMAEMSKDINEAAENTRSSTNELLNTVNTFNL